MGVGGFFHSKDVLLLQRMPLPASYDRTGSNAMSTRDESRRPVLCYTQGLAKLVRGLEAGVRHHRSAPDRIRGPGQPRPHLRMHNDNVPTLRIKL